uniref:Chorismate lyase n=2 Tax=Kappaphycus TaxID=38543 RepID=A0A8E7PGR2_9FLOR|nr:hypothetical protein [Kappaphycus striatus]
MNIKGKYKLFKSFILHFHSSNYQQNYVNFCMPKEWQLLLISDGSFTQTLTSLTGQQIYIDQLSRYTYQSINDVHRLRDIWLKDHKSNKLIFAKSLWFLSANIDLPSAQPIGKSLILYEKDVYRDIHEFYYGHCTYLESKFHYRGPVWGRKYTIYYKQEPLTTLQEVFAPLVINFFDK